MKLSEQGQRQNTIMLVFTIVTIIFLPLSFIASFFTIGIREFPQNAESGETAWPIRDVSTYLFTISVAVSAVVLIGIGLLFARMSRKNKKRMERAKLLAPPKPWELVSGATGLDSAGTRGGSDTLKNKKKKRKRNHRKHDDDGNSIASDHDSDLTSASGYESDASRDGKTDDDDSDTESEGTNDDDNEYAPLLNRWRWHTHIPGVRRLWLWKLYKVKSPPAIGGTRTLWHRMRRSEEKWEWDYPLSRWRARTIGKVRLRFDKIVMARERRRDKARNGDKMMEEGRNSIGARDREPPPPPYDHGYYHRHSEVEREARDEECNSEDERSRRGGLEAGHKERVEERKEWIADIGSSARNVLGGWLGRHVEDGGKKHDTEDGERRAPGEHDVSATGGSGRGSPSLITAIFRRRRSERMPDEEMGVDRRGN